jgi:hypothetical protein
MFAAMDASITSSLPADFASELERKYFWWEPVGGHRSDARILAQAMDGDLPSLPETDREILRAARDRVSAVPEVTLEFASLAAPRQGKT